MGEKIRTKMTEDPICPYCGHIHKGLIFFGNKELKCQKCGKIYKYDFYVFYSSWKKEELNGSTRDN